jgi:hypothetical protein
LKLCELLLQCWVGVSKSDIVNEKLREKGRELRERDCMNQLNCIL